MKHYKVGVAAVIAVSMMMAAVFPMKLQAVKEDTVRNIEPVSVSDMVYQSGGWGTPVEEGMIPLYAIDEREQLKEEIWNVLQKDERILDVSKYKLTLEDRDDLKSLFAEVLNAHPELFYVKSSISYSYNGAEQILNLFFYYEDFTSDEREAFAKKLEQAASLVRPDMTEVEKALVLHDYLSQHCAYAYSEYLQGTLGNCRNVYNAYGALVEGKAVCQGYALAYSSLLRYVGIDSDLCSSDAMNHAWNVVLVDGEWYHVDVTWDDPVWNTEGRARHGYFLLSDAEMGNREHSGWVSTVECTSEKYDAEDYWWNAVQSQIVLEDKQYCIESTDRGFQLTERDGDVSSPKYVNNTVWNVWGNEASYWRGSFSYLSRQGDYLYFNDKKNLYALKLTESTPQIIYTYEGGDGYIYGAMVYEEGMARLNIDQSPSRNSDSFIAVDLREEAPTLTVDYGTNTISTTADMEYSIDNGATWIPCTDNMKTTDLGWNGIKEMSVSFRIPADGGRFASETTVVTLQAQPGTLSGTVIGFGNADALTTIQLLDAAGAVVCETAVTGNSAEYALEEVGEGTYTLIIGKQNHVTRAYTLTVGDEAVIQDVELHLVGDINGDGRINAGDKKMLYNHIAGVAMLEDYELSVADVNGDGKINARDNKILYNHMAGLSLLW